MEVFSGVLSALGLSGAAGLNAYIPLFLVGVLANLGLVQLDQPFDLLGNTWTLLVIFLVGLADFVGDKIPGVDHVLHLVSGWVGAAAGAVLFASQAGVADLSPTLATALGLLVAGGIQTGRAAVRPAATTLTAGVGNPVVSTVEDGLSLGLSVLALFVPALAALGLLGLVWWAWRLYRRWGQRRAVHTA
ncbi:hypothetical protein Deipr_0225 [Deinococcus proteolyticus MRP]|uniref:DUF4126 domain-containing protein n=1 Tax=Deinococcus proteolyticus (strain ATCC 35074 / DSM 20540 / JCM 6276 / NBRC 101906 / NCIMB 13154 / VKM Ac-1939 / CCM 2703 / MRP) TaxID=693977 RepID=F0RIZ0_DEIPM|nr:DUF4126 domain-containing protein [Deinococcus proteolyticus]ADY25398.1 hypothetical protein Deipr_0225 [Deinococcus proteolyticus MRP]